MEMYKRTKGSFFLCWNIIAFIPEVYKEEKEAPKWVRVEPVKFGYFKWFWLK